jgi:hypothetical protein
MPATVRSGSMTRVTRLWATSNPARRQAIVAMTGAASRFRNGSSGWPSARSIASDGMSNVAIRPPAITARMAANPRNGR